jgi:hypothetical protein
MIVLFHFRRWHVNGLILFPFIWSAIRWLHVITQYVSPNNIRGPVLTSLRSIVSVYETNGNWSDSTHGRIHNGSDWTQKYVY